MTRPDKTIKNPNTKINKTLAPSSSFWQKNDIKYMKESDEILITKTSKEKYITTPLT